MLDFTDHVNKCGCEMFIFIMPRTRYCWHDAVLGEAGRIDRSSADAGSVVWSGLYVSRAWQRSRTLNEAAFLPNHSALVPSEVSYGMLYEHA